MRWSGHGKYLGTVGTQGMTGHDNRQRALPTCGAWVSSATRLETLKMSATVTSQEDEGLCEKHRLNILNFTGL